MRVCVQMHAGADIDRTKICDADEPVALSEQPLRCERQTCQLVSAEVDPDCLCQSASKLYSGRALHCAFILQLLMCTYTEIAQYRLNKKNNNNLYTTFVLLH